MSIINTTAKDQYKLGLVLYQPEIPQNAGTLIRLCAAFCITLYVIEPCGFVWSSSQLRRAGLDYHALSEVKIFASDNDFFSYAHYHNRRIILLDTKATTSYVHYSYHCNDIIMVGRESTGVPDDVYGRCHHQVCIPMTNAGVRSLNVAMAASIVLAHIVHGKNP
jgi:tRNA (cytidine/uridine-2'-O-)-methyltransferase